MYLDSHIFVTPKDPDKMEDNYDWLWKAISILDKLSDSYAKYYSPTAHVTDAEIITLFEGEVIFKRSILKKHRSFGIKIYELLDSKGYMYNITV
jgi:hypothetical protein